LKENRIEPSSAGIIGFWRHTKCWPTADNRIFLNAMHSHMIFHLYI